MDIINAATLASLFVIGEWVIRLVMVAVVPFRRSPAAAKGWLLLIFFEPWIGLIVYGLIGRPHLRRWRRERMAHLSEVLAQAAENLRDHPSIFQPELAPELCQSAVLARNLGHLPMFGGNAGEILVDYQGTIARLVADIDAAQHHVHLLYYIFADDQTTAPVIAALERAAARGVCCRVLLDSLGSRRYLKSLLPKLRAAGVQVHETLPVGFFRRHTGRIDLRNHRKIAVVDGRVGYTGSQNLIDPNFKVGITYEELVVRVLGPIVLQLQFVFASDWYVETGELLQSADVFAEPQTAGDLAAQALPSGPGYATENNQRLIVSLVHAARRQIVITIPYFIPDEALLQALQTAVLRGVDVRLVLSQQADQLLVSLAQKSYYEELLEAGVQIYLYRTDFLHAKHVSVDDSIAWIGSSNMDIRSFALNAEIVLLFYDPHLTALLQAEQARYFRHCEVLTSENWGQRPLRSKVLQNLARLLSPLL